MVDQPKTAFVKIVTQIVLEADVVKVTMKDVVGVAAVAEVGVVEEIVTTDTTVARKSQYLHYSQLVNSLTERPK